MLASSCLREMLVKVERSIQGQEMRTVQRDAGRSRRYRRLGFQVSRSQCI